MARLTPHFTLMAGMLLLAACDTVSDTVDLMSGSNEPETTKIAGERIAVLAQDAVLQVDESLDDISIEIAPAEDNSDWPQHAGSVAGFTTTLSISGTLEDDQSTSIGEGVNFEYGAVVSPIVAAGNVFVMDAEGNISAHSVDDISDELWVSEGVINAEEEPMIGGGLAFSGGTLYAISGNGLAAAFDPASGRELWRQDIRIPVRAAPLIASGKLFVVTADSKLFAMDAATGDVIWEDQGLSEGASFLANAAPVFHNGLLAIPYASAEMKVVTADEGRTLWGDVLALTKRNSAASNFSGIGGAPVIIENAIYAVSTAGVLAAYRLDNGLRVWEQPISSANRPWVSGNTLFVLSTSGQLAALNRIDGRIFWVAKLPAYEDEERRLDPYHWTGPVLAGETLYVVGSHGVMKRINATSGEILEDIDIPSGILSPPVIAGGKMYLVSQDATLYALH